MLYISLYIHTVRILRKIQKRECVCVCVRLKSERCRLKLVVVNCFSSAYIIVGVQGRTRKRVRQN